MPVLRTLGKTIMILARVLHAIATGAVLLGRFVGRNVLTARQRGAAGETGMVRLLDLHAASCAGDTLVAIGLAGTIFFTVPAGEARGRVALYLLVTMLPFALLAPVVGPVLDRFRHGRRYALATTMLGRAFLGYLISEHLGGLALYPAAFGVLVLSRAYGVARSAAVPRLLPAELGLSEAGARASVYGTLAGGIIAPLGLAAAAFGPAWSLRLSTVVFLFGMVTALRLPPRADSDPPEAVPRLLQRPGRKGAKVLSGQLVVATLVGSGTLRAAYGFLTLYLAFAVRSGGAVLPDRFLAWRLSQPTALGLVAGALAVGSFLATTVGTRLRIRRPVRLQATGVALSAVAAIVVAAHPSLATATLMCLVTATASGLAKLAVDAVIQERIPEGVRASAFAHSETLLMIAWVSGGGLGLLPFAGRWGLLLLAVLTALAAARAVAAAVLLRGERLHGQPHRDDPDRTATAADARGGADDRGGTDDRRTTGERTTVQVPGGRLPDGDTDRLPGGGPDRLPGGDAGRRLPDDAPGRRRWFGLRRGAGAQPAGARPEDTGPEDVQPAGGDPPAAVPAPGSRSGRPARTRRLPAGELPPQRTPEQSMPAAQAAQAGQRPGRELPGWLGGSDSAANDPDAAEPPEEPRPSGPGFHLYRPSGLVGGDDEQ